MEKILFILRKFLSKNHLLVCRKKYQIAKKSSIPIELLQKNRIETCIRFLHVCAGGLCVINDFKFVIFYNLVIF